MRLLTRISLLGLAAFLILFSAGCGDDGPGLPGGVILDPTITLNTGPGLTAFNTDVAADSIIVVNVTVDDGDNPLRDLAIRENGTIMPSGRLAYRTGQTANNPLLITGAERSGATYEIEITPGSAGARLSEYSFVVTDSEGLTATTNLSINYLNPVPTVTTNLEGDNIGTNMTTGQPTVTSRNTSFTVRAAATAQDGATLSSVTVLEDGVAMPANQLLFDGQMSASNPLGLGDAETSATVVIRISPDGAENTSRTYTVQFTDSNGFTGESSFDLFFDTPPGTALTFDTTGVFFNSTGAENGGLDLDRAVAVPFNSPDAEIQDEGVNVRIAVGTENWRAQISAGSSAATVRTADLSTLGDGTTFDDISTQEEISDLFTSGGELDGDDNFPSVAGDLSNNEDVSQPILGADANSEGEIFVVERDGRFYLVRFDAVNFVANSNDDNYTVSIKY